MVREGLWPGGHGSSRRSRSRSRRSKSRRSRRPEAGAAVTRPVRDEGGGGLRYTLHRIM